MYGIKSITKEQQIKKADKVIAYATALRTAGKSNTEISYAVFQKFGYSLNAFQGKVQLWLPSDTSKINSPKYLYAEL